MREVIQPTRQTYTTIGELVVTVLDDPSILPSDPGTHVWCPESTAVGTCSWDLLAAVPTAAAADSVCEHLFAVVVDDAATYFVPEASLLTANLLLAASRGGRPLADVITWVRGGQLAPAAQLLEDVDEVGAVEDLEAFAASSPGEQAAIWAVVRQVMLPLGTPAALKALSMRPVYGFIRGTVPQFTMAAYAVPFLVDRVVIAVAPRSPLSGVANAFRSWLLLTAARSFRPVRIVHGDSGGM